MTVEAIDDNVEVISNLKICILNADLDKINKLDKRKLDANKLDGFS